MRQNRRWIQLLWRDEGINPGVDDRSRPSAAAKAIPLRQAEYFSFLAMSLGVAFGYASCECARQHYSRVLAACYTKKPALKSLFTEYQRWGSCADIEADIFGNVQVQCEFAILFYAAYARASQRLIVGVNNGAAQGHGRR